MDDEMREELDSLLDSLRDCAEMAIIFCDLLPEDDGMAASVICAVIVKYAARIHMKSSDVWNAFMRYQNKYIRNLETMQNETNYTRSVDCRGYMDDPYCPDCNAAISDDKIDSPVCPYCGCRLDWKIYHILND